MSTLIFFLMGVAHADDLADAIREQTHSMEMQRLEDELMEAKDLRWCTENAENARNRIIPTCKKLPPNEHCKFLIEEFYRRKCHRWGL